MIDLEARMLSGEPFTWGQLGGTSEVDRTIQKLRKAGLIAFERKGRNCVWRATGASVVDQRDKRIAELEAALRAALRHAEANGMKDWPVFVAIRKALG